MPEIVFNNTDGDKEPLINSTRMSSIIADDQAGATDLISNAELKQNSNLFVFDVQSSTPLSRGFFQETYLVGQYGHGEQNQLFPCPGDHIITEWEHPFLELR